MMKEQQKQHTPPYLSIPKLKKVINLVSTRNFPKITNKMFVAERFSDSDAALAVSTLKFLRIIDKEGSATPLMSKLHLKGEARKLEFEKIIRAAYSALFAVVEKPEALSTDDLTNEMIRQYNLTPRLVGSAVKAFLKLAEYAGLKDEGSIVSKARAPRNSAVIACDKSKKTPSPPEKQMKDGTLLDAVPSLIDTDLSLINIVEGKLVIGISRKLQEQALFEKEAGDDLRDLLSAAR